ncbi:MAG: hypothetical protein K0S04_3026 [Herbinix sp.]|jgi:hypothetical protein|nr:hypothetical protein [Herbinix sp.]
MNIFLFIHIILLSLIRVKLFILLNCSLSIGLPSQFLNASDESCQLFLLAASLLFIMIQLIFWEFIPLGLIGTFESSSYKVGIMKRCKVKLMGNIRIKPLCIFMQQFIQINGFKLLTSHHLL